MGRTERILASSSVGSLTGVKDPAGHSSVTQLFGHFQDVGKAVSLNSLVVVSPEGGAHWRPRKPTTDSMIL